MNLRHSTVLLYSCYDKPSLVANSTAYILPDLRVQLLHRTVQVSTKITQITYLRLCSDKLSPLAAALFTFHPDLD